MRSTARLTTAVVFSLSLVSQAAAEPRGAYEKMFEPLRDMLAPCTEAAERCIADGKEQSVCRAEAEQCERALEERMKEELIKELEKEDPSARRTMAAMDAHQACVSKILDCFDRTKNISQCVKRAPTCRAKTRQGSAEACCPSACINVFQAQVEKGVGEIEAYGDIFIRNPSCFPGLPTSASP
ncbi:MAG TPA: hypothetical protein VJP78_03290 [Thermoleophilia bacterium]|nr:hypothetical protein [Thermoleophilia bacterium]